LLSANRAKSFGRAAAFQLTFEIAIAMPNFCNLKSNAAFGKNLRQSCASAAAMFFEARHQILGGAEIMLRAHLPAMWYGLLVMQ
jgi:hypothetical protein